ncbi:MAG: hypothetical protein ACLGHN_11490 [Bacteriovoracia bacterium]
MRFSLLLIGLFTLPLFAAGPVELRNDREGESFYSSRWDKRSIRKALNGIDSKELLGAFDETLKEQEPHKLCSFDLNNSLLEKIHRVNPRFKEMKGAILYLRSQNEFDDTVAKLLLDADKISNTSVYRDNDRDQFGPSLPRNKETVEMALKAISRFEKKLENSCFDEAYQSLYGEILRFDKHLKKYHFEALFEEAYDQRIISYDVYQNLEKARTNELESSTLTLKTYYKKIQSLRTQFPLRDPEEKTDFVTEKDGKLKLSRRQQLLASYTDLQIMLMADVIKKLRTRLESPKAEILIYDRQNGVETIELGPMERFRLAIKLLRKENSLLALNTYFAGRTPDYMDLMTAAYETGIIPASELEELAGLEEIWNPKKTFWEKAGVWIRTFGSVATIAIPPPYGFIPALAIVVIEMTAGKKEDNSNDPTVLF